MPQCSIPCAIYRGGTSRGLFFHQRDLPDNQKCREKIFYAGIDAYNSSQVDGIGSGTSHTSKVVIIGPPSVAEVDVDYTFVQIGIGEETSDMNGTCGNLMSAVGSFAIDEGLVQVNPHVDQVTINVYDTNIKKKLRMVVPVENGRAKVIGDYHMPGLVKPGARIRVDILNPGGGKTGETLPLGPLYTIRTAKDDYEISFVDIVNPFVFVDMRMLGLKGIETSNELSRRQELIDELNAIRDEAAIVVGFANNSLQAKVNSPAIPKIAFVAAPQDYISTSGSLIRGCEIDIIAKMLSMGRLHRTFAASGLCCLAAAALLPGTIPNKLARVRDEREQTLRIGHPDGIAEVRVSLTDDGTDIAYVGLDRTARRIVRGTLFFPE